jgi:hypothetical protein
LEQNYEKPHQPRNILARNLVDELQVRCRHHALGCGWQGMLQDRGQHESSPWALTILPDGRKKSCNSW